MATESAAVSKLIRPGARTAPSVLLNGVDWRTYSRLLAAFEACPGVRLNYDRGQLEIMSPSYRHDQRGHFLCRMICAMTEEADLPIKGGRSTTLRLRKMQKGLEPDDCYWIANSAAIEGRDEIDLRVDPPPDLAVEIDETNSSLNRFEIYDSLGVPEIWRLHDGRLTFLRRNASGGYLEIEFSVNFPWLRAADLIPFLEQAMNRNENPVLRQFRGWVRDTIENFNQSP